MSKPIRLHVYLAHLGITSRRKAEQLIQEGKVQVNGKIAVIGQSIQPEKDEVIVEDRKIGETPEKPIYLLLNKPRGYVSTAQDELGRKNVTELIPTRYGRVYPVGRLDLESEGLLLMTNDGDTAYVMTHPSFEVEKTYQVLIDRVPSTLALEHLRKGVLLKEGLVRPLSLKVLSHEEQRRTWLEIVIKEGRNQQVRRMMRRIGYEVLQLRRVAMGPLELKNLLNGQFRVLSDLEIQALLAFVYEKKTRKEDIKLDQTTSNTED